MIRRTETNNSFFGEPNVQNKCRHGRPSHSTYCGGSHHRSGSLLSIMAWLDRAGTTGDGVYSMVPRLRTVWAQHMRRKVRRGLTCLSWEMERAE